MAKLPSVSSNIPRDLRTFVDRVREALDSKSPDAAVTARQLVAAGIASYTGNILGPATAEETQVTPSRPKNVTASGALANIMVTWDKPVYANHAFAEIWAASRTAEQEAVTPVPEDPTIGQAELVGMSPGTFFAHNIGAGGDRWYWVRFVNFAGTVGPYQSTEGVAGSTGQDPTYLLDVLNGEISESELATSLSDRIDLIDGASTVSGSVNARIASVQEQLNEFLNIPSWDSATAYAIDDQVVHEGSLYVALAASTNVEPGTDATKWENIGDYASIGDAVAAHTIRLDNLDDDVGANATSISTLATQVRGSYAGDDLSLVTQGLLFDERTARAEADSALASDISTVTALANSKNRTFYQATAPTGTTELPLEVGDMWVDTDQELADDYLDGDYVIRSNRIYRYDGTDWVEAMDYGFADFFSALRTEKTARVTEDEALATSITDLTTATNTSLATINSTLTTHTTDISSNALAVSTLRTELVGDDTTQGTIYAAVQVEAEARADETGDLFAQYTVKVDTNGYVSGFGLASTEVNGTPYSEFIVNADSFAIGRPGSTEEYPFIVRTTETTINGETIPVGVYMKDAFIQNGTITNAKIGDAAIDNAKIANVDAGKITTGYLDADRIEAGSIDANKIDTRGLDIKDADGNVVFASGTPLNSEYIDYDGLNNVGLFWNSNFTMAATDGRPAGCYASFSNSDKSTISYQDAAKTILKLYSDTDNHIGVAMAAFRCDPTVTYKVIVRAKADSAASLAFYIRMNELDTEMDSGTKFIGNAAREDGGETYTRSVEINSGNSDITTEWVDYVHEWQPTSTAKWASLQLMNTINMGYGELHVDRAVIVPAQTKITETNASTYIEDAAIGTAQIKDGTITNAKIGDTIQSEDFVSGSKGWRFTKGDGTATGPATLEMNGDSVFRGDLDIKSAEDGERMEMNNETIKVYDDQGVLRVKIGKL